MAVTIYTTPTSPWCKQAKALLRARGVPFEEVDVSKDRDRVEDLRRLSGQLGVPVVTDGRTIVIGFDEPSLEKLAAGHRDRTI